MGDLEKEDSFVRVTFVQTALCSEPFQIPLADLSLIYNKTFLSSIPWSSDVGSFFIASLSHSSKPSQTLTLQNTT